MIEKLKNGFLFDDRCFINDEAKHNYIARLQWVYLSAAITQLQTVYEHCRIVDRLTYIYNKFLSDNSELAYVSENILLKLENEIHKQYYIHRTEQDISSTIQKQYKECTRLKEDAKKAQDVICNLFKNFDANQWWNNSKLASDAPEIKWKNVPYLIVFEKFLYQCVKLSTKMIDQNRKYLLDEELEKIMVYWQIFSQRYTKKDHAEGTPADEQMQSFYKTEEAIENFLKINFVNDLYRITGQKSMFQILVEKKAEVKNKNQGKGLSIDTLLVWFEWLGYDRENLSVPIYGENMLPAVLAVAKQDMFESLFPVPNPKADVNTLLQNKRFQSIWDYDPEQDAFMYALLNSPCDWPIGAEPLDSHRMEDTFQALCPEYIPNEDMEEDEIETAEQEDEEEQMKIVKDFLLDAVYQKYPEIKDYMKEIVQEYPELKERLDL